MKALAAHHPIIQKEVGKLLAKGAIKPSSAGAGFYSSVFHIPMSTGGLTHILCSFLICLGLQIIFSKSDLHLTHTFCFFGIMLGYCPYVSTFAS